MPRSVNEPPSVGLEASNPNGSRATSNTPMVAPATQSGIRLPLRSSISQPSAKTRPSEPVRPSQSSKATDVQRESLPAAPVPRENKPSVAAFPLD